MILRFRMADRVDPRYARAQPRPRIPPLAALKPCPRDPRAHSKKQARKIAESIRRFGFAGPVLVDDNNRILAGQSRLGARPVRAGRAFGSRRKRAC